MPCVCVSDDLFSITTSQKLTRNLVAGLGEEKSEGGAYFSVNMEALKSAAESWVKLIEENGEEILGDADTAAEFNDNLPQVKELIEAVSELKEIKSHNWKDGDNVRGTLHFRTK